MMTLSLSSPLKTSVADYLFSAIENKEIIDLSDLQQSLKRQISYADTLLKNKVWCITDIAVGVCAHATESENRLLPKKLLANESTEALDRFIKANNEGDPEDPLMFLPEPDDIVAQTERKTLSAEMMALIEKGAINSMNAALSLLRPYVLAGSA